MTSLNQGINPTPIGPPMSNSRSSSNASSAASAAASAALMNALGRLPSNANANGNASANANVSASANANANAHDSSNGTANPSYLFSALNTALNTAAADRHSVLVRRLAAGNNSKALSHITAYCGHGLVHADTIDPEHSSDPGYMGAILQYDSQQAAAMAAEKLNGMRNISFDSKMSAEYLGTNASPFAQSPFSQPAMSRAGAAPPLLSQPAGPFTNSTFQISSSAGSHQSQGLADNSRDHPAIVQEAFSRPRPIGNHLSDRGLRTSSLDLINSGAADDPIELTFGSLSLNDNSSLDTAAHPEMPEPPRPQLGGLRRSTMPQIPTIRSSAGLRLDTANNYGPGPTMFSAHPSALSAQQAQQAQHMATLSPGALNGSAAFLPPHSRRGPPHPAAHGGRHMVPHANPSDQHPPCNTLYVGNIPLDADEGELKSVFMTQRGYKRLSLRTKNNNTMCFVEFEDITAATKALDELYGRPLSNSNHRGGMRLSYSKNPFGVRSEHNPNNRMNPTAMHGMAMAGGMNGMGPAMYGHGPAAGAGALGNAQPAPPPGLPLPASISAARPRRNDGLGASLGAQISASAYTQMSPWNQSQAQQQQAYALPLSQSYRSYEDDGEYGVGVGVGAGGASASANGSSGPGDYAFQGSAGSSAFSPIMGGIGAHDSYTAAFAGMPMTQSHVQAQAQAQAQAQVHSNGYANANAGSLFSPSTPAGASTGYAGEAAGRPNSNFGGQHLNGQAYMPYAAFN